MTTPHPRGPRCLRCGRVRDDPLHGQAELGGLHHENVPVRFKQHEFDPGERRDTTRRSADRNHEAKDRQKDAWSKARDQHDIDEWNKKHPKDDL